MLKKINSAERIQSQATKSKEMLYKKEKLKNLQQELKKISRKNNIKKNILMTLQIAPILLGINGVRESFNATTSVCPIKEITINENGYNSQVTGEVKNLFDYNDIDQSYIKYIGEWNEVSKNSDMVYRICIDMKDEQKIKDFIDAYMIWDVEKIGRCLDVEIETTSKNSELYVSEESSSFELSYKYLDESNSKEVPSPIWVKTILAFLAGTLGIGVSLLIRSSYPIILDYSKEDETVNRIRKLEQDLEK